MIDPAVVSQIVETANIVDVISDFVTIRKKGANYMACCPFHNEKTPSFSIAPNKGIFKCFGCGKAGNSVSFVMEHERFSYVEALKYLAKKYHIEIIEKEVNEADIQKKNDRESLMIISGFAQTYFSQQLTTIEGKAVGASYFKERGFTKNTIEKFQLGYSPEKRTSLVEAASAAGYKTNFLLQAGLCYERESDKSLGDRFAGRVMFPIHSLSGRVIAFGGRTLRTDKKVAKYLNSPESEIYQKRAILYGIFFAKKAISQQDKCYLVEGYTDVLSMHQAGIENVVAASGTSLTYEQIHMIGRFTNHVTILFDGDSAGIKASLRGIDMLLEQGMSIKVCLLPEGEDPDSFARKHNAIELQNFLDQHEEDFMAFKIQLLSADALNDPLKKAEIIKDIVNSIAVIPDLITRTVYAKSCGKTLEIDEEVLRSEISKIRRSKITKRADSTATDPPILDIPFGTKISVPAYISNLVCEEQERELLMLMLRYGRLGLFKIEEDGEDRVIHVDEYIIVDIKNDDLKFENLRFKEMFEAYESFLINSDQNIEPLKQLLNHPDPAIVSEVINLMQDPYELSSIWGPVAKTPIDLQIAVPKAIAVYKSKIINMAYHQTAESLNMALEEEEQKQLLSHFVQLGAQRMALSKLLSRPII